jgi:hypothetical protein
VGSLLRLAGEPVRGWPADDSSGITAKIRVQETGFSERCIPFTLAYFGV